LLGIYTHRANFPVVAAGQSPKPRDIANHWHRDQWQRVYVAFAEDRDGLCFAAGFKPGAVTERYDKPA
jgi:hypothetical protein